MLEQGIRLYGDPCRECGFTWSMSQADAEGVLAEIPGRMRTALAGSDGTARHPDLTWTAAAYICHVGDNLRIYTERMAGAAAGEGRARSTAARRTALLFALCHVHGHQPGL